MNFLVYLGLLNYDQPGARRQLAERSLALFEKEWKQNGHVHENYNSITGEGDDVGSSDRFYHWGALLGLVELHGEQPPLIAGARSGPSPPIRAADSQGFRLPSISNLPARALFLAELQRFATVNPPVILFGGWCFAQTSNTTGAHGKRI